MEQVFDEKFFKGLPAALDDANGALLAKLRKFEAKRPFTKDIAHALLEGLAVYGAWRSHNNMESMMPNPAQPFQVLLQASREIIEKYKKEHDAKMSVRLAEEAMERGKQWFALQSGTLFGYEFSDDEIAHIQRQLDLLEGLIADAEELEQAHKDRLLRRLSQLRSELQKRVADLDRFWGLVGDAGIVIKS